MNSEIQVKNLSNSENISQKNNGFRSTLDARKAEKGNREKRAREKREQEKTLAQNILQEKQKENRDKTMSNESNSPLDRTTKTENPTTALDSFRMTAPSSRTSASTGGASV